MRIASAFAQICRLIGFRCLNERATGVSSYSTRGGTAGKTVRFTSPSRSSPGSAYHRRGT